MRAAAVPYSSLAAGSSRERNTTTIMQLLLSRIVRPRVRCASMSTVPASATTLASRRPSRPLLVAMDRGQGRDPRQRRTEPVLPLRHELPALAQDADAYAIRRLHACARRCRIDRRAAARTERLNARRATVGGGLEIVGRLARHLERRARH